MPDSAPATRVTISHARRTRSRRFRWTLGVVIALAVCVFAVIWIGARGVAAKNELQSALPLVNTLKSQVVAQDVTGAKKTLAKLEPKTAAARANTSDPIWRIAELVPVLGPNLSAVRVLAGSTDDVVSKSIKPLVGVLSTVSPASLKPVDGALDLKPIEKAIPTVDRAAAALSKAHKEVASIDPGGTIGPVRAATTQLADMLGKVDEQMQQAKAAVHALPAALGADKPRNYLVVFENSGELLANGGTTGSMALLKFDHGKISLVKQSSASGREFPRFKDYIIPLPEDVKRLYPQGLGKQVQDLTITPRFSLTYDVAKAMWKTAKGDTIDGIVAMDTVTLGKLLEATGPVDVLPGLQLNAENAARLLLIDIYAMYPDPATVDKVQQAVAINTFTKILGGGADPKKMLEILMKAGEEGRVKAWTGDKAEQKLIKLTPFYAEPPVSTKTTDWFGAYFMDQTPSKMDYFLRVKFNVRQNVCSDGHRYVMTRVSLRSTAPADSAEILPEYVLGNGLLVAQGNVQIGTSVYAPPGYTVLGTAIDAVPQAAPMIGSDGEYPVAQAVQQMAPGQTVEFDALFDAGKTPIKTLKATATPTVNPTEISGGPLLDCAAIGK
ncbi:DUF4012 domain-containing protein [Leifsonia sp. F6_8S_P_1B]|uniref:DUF4012 domain-containing protein n=1 Tax=Leifsonia williamsii TaxID=3035919 RepID=A0ABT8KFC3_9MICO|nr:DUF4012 domain-containing protein [Leifsonia williamsii]MDN4616146.1 DUF4012 domain-containing protein [Leifsonia williamsii]